MLYHAVLNEAGEAEIVDSIEDDAVATFEEPTAVDVGVRIITEYAVCSEVNASTFGQLVDMSVPFVREHGGFNAIAAGAMADALDASEESYIASTAPETKKFAKGTKAGKYVKTGILPATYLQARSVVLGAIAEGVPTFTEEDGMVKPAGKTALEKARKGEKETKSPEEKLAALVQTVAALCKQTADPFDAALKFEHELRSAVR